MPEALQSGLEWRLLRGEGASQTVSDLFFFSFSIPVERFTDHSVRPDTYTLIIITMSDMGGLPCHALDFEGVRQCPSSGRLVEPMIKYGAVRCGYACHGLWTVTDGAWASTSGRCPFAFLLRTTQCDLLALCARVPMSRYCRRRICEGRKRKEHVFGRVLKPLFALAHAYLKHTYLSRYVGTQACVEGTFLTFLPALQNNDERTALLRNFFQGHRTR